MSKPPFVRSPYNYDVNKASDESGLLCEDESLTVQAEAEDADINTIVKRFGLTGMMPQNVRMPMSGDFAEATDYHTSLNRLIAADQAFMEFPAHIRARFDHDPAKMIEFCENPANLEEARKLGLAVPAPVAAPAASDAPTATPSGEGAP